MTSRDELSKLDTGVPHSARIWNYWLGGTANFAADRQAGDQVLAVFPPIVENARAARAFLGRAVRYLAGERNIRQFLDLGAGLPAANNTHEIAQSVAPESRVVYVDNDPLVHAHARALLADAPEGRTAFVEADARDTERVLAEARRTLDLDQPVAVIMLGLLGNIPDDDEARAVVTAIVGAVAPGSFLVVNDGTRTGDEIAAGARVSSTGGHPYALRLPDEIARYFDGLELVEPGLVPTTHWRPPGGDTSATLDGLGGVARKP